MDRITPDKYHGQGGTYEVVNGERVLVKGSTIEHHKDGDGARDAKGQAIVNTPPSKKPEPAMPEPVAMPWDAPVAAKPAEARTFPSAVRVPAAASETSTTKGS